MSWTQATQYLNSSFTIFIFLLILTFSLVALHRIALSCLGWCGTRAGHALDTRRQVIWLWKRQCVNFLDTRSSAVAGFLCLICQTNSSHLNELRYSTSVSWKSLVAPMCTFGSKPTSFFAISEEPIASPFQSGCVLLRLRRSLRTVQHMPFQSASRGTIDGKLKRDDSGKLERSSLAAVGAQRLCSRSHNLIDAQSWLHLQNHRVHFPQDSYVSKMAYGMMQKHIVQRPEAKNTDTLGLGHIFKAK